MIQMYNGAILMTPGKEVATQCCCGASPSPTTGNTPLLTLNCTSGPFNTYPRMKVTLCWEQSGPSEKDFLNDSWSNGESKIVCPHVYDQFRFDTAGERWQVSADFGFIFLSVAGSSAAQARNDVAFGFGIIPSTGDYKILMQNGLTSGTTYQNQNIYDKGTTVLGLTPVVFQGPIQPSMFTYVIGDGPDKTTVKWEPLSGVGQSWDNWRATNLSYAPTVGFASCPRP